MCERVRRKRTFLSTFLHFISLSFSVALQSPYSLSSLLRMKRLSLHSLSQLSFIPFLLLQFFTFSHLYHTNGKGRRIERGRNSLHFPFSLSFSNHRECIQNEESASTRGNPRSLSTIVKEEREERELFRRDDSILIITSPLNWLSFPLMDQGLSLFDKLIFVWVRKDLRPNEIIYQDHAGKGAIVTTFARFRFHFFERI